MAIYHLSATLVQRSKGHSAVAGAAYRSGTVLREELTGLVHDYQRKRGIVQSAILVPDNAPWWANIRCELWNRAERAEKRKDAQPAREIRLGLPHELTDRQRADLVFGFSRDMFVNHGMVVDISIHRPDRHGDSRNHHAHIYLTMRELDGEGFSVKKTRDWNKKELLEHWREQWEKYQNAALEEAGANSRVDHRTLEAQGIKREPTWHLGKAASTIEREGKQSRIGDENRAIAQRNQELDQLVSELAQVEAEIQRELDRQYMPEPEEPAPLWTARVNGQGTRIWNLTIDGQHITTWQEEKRQAQHVSNSVLTPPPEKGIRPHSAEPERTEPQPWEEEKRRAQHPSKSLFSRLSGEARHYFSGKGWYANTVFMVENVYCSVKTIVKETWQRFVTADREHYEPER